MPWALLAPQLALFVPFIFLPVIAIFVLSLFDWNLLGGHHFVAFGNYRELLTDEQFWRAMRNTLEYAAVITPATLLLGLALALALNRKLPGRTFFRTAIYLPTVVSSVASGVIAAWIFDEHYGVLNSALASFHLPRLPWLSSTSLAMPSVMATTIWLRTGLCMIVYLAALQEIPHDLLDAAALDGAGPWQRFRHITWPLLAPSTTFLLVTTLIYSLHVFDLIYVMTYGGPAFSTTTLVQYLFETGFDDQRQGYACSISVVLFLFILTLTSLLLRQRRGPKRSAS